MCLSLLMDVWCRVPADFEYKRAWTVKALFPDELAHYTRSREGFNCVPVFLVLRHAVLRSRDDCLVEAFQMPKWFGMVFSGRYGFYNEHCAYSCKILGRETAGHCLLGLSSVCRSHWLSIRGRLSYCYYRCFSVGIDLLSFEIRFVTTTLYWPPPLVLRREPGMSMAMNPSCTVAGDNRNFRCCSLDCRLCAHDFQSLNVL